MKVKKALTYILEFFYF